jgi:hypothetical protein
MLEMTAMRDVVFVAITLYSPESFFTRCRHSARIIREPPRRGTRRSEPNCAIERAMASPIAQSSAPPRPRRAGAGRLIPGKRDGRPARSGGPRCTREANHIPGCDMPQTRLTYFGGSRDRTIAVLIMDAARCNPFCRMQKLRHPGSGPLARPETGKARGTLPAGLPAMRRTPRLPAIFSGKLFLWRRFCVPIR